jgi:tRNA (cmo5U34)-methyltransferase
MKDELFSGSGAPEKFEFNENVARVFDDMLERSIPHYRECQEMVVDWCTRFAREDSNLSDLGCSTGTLLLRVGSTFSEHARTRLIGIDNSMPMLDKARQNLQSVKIPWELVHADLDGDFSLTNASVVVMNYTLQFIAPERRQFLLGKIFKGLRPGGCLLLTEKVLGDSPKLDTAFVEIHHRFKRERGYSDLEISRKREALENVLTPLKLHENIELLKQAGFRNVDVFFKWNNFAGLIALP